jgi:hypothetical protein
VQTTQSTTPAASAVATSATDIEAAAQQCGVAFIRALQDLRDSEDELDLDEFEATFDRYLEEERGS